MASLAIAIETEMGIASLANLDDTSSGSFTFNLTNIPVVTDTAIVTERIGSAAPTVVSGANYAISASPNLITFTGGNAPAALTHVWYPVERNDL